jgi:hypothetical protein
VYGYYFFLRANIFFIYSNQSFHDSGNAMLSVVECLQSTPTHWIPMACFLRGTTKRNGMLQWNRHRPTFQIHALPFCADIMCIIAGTNVL